MDSRKLALELGVLCRLPASVGQRGGGQLGAPQWRCRHCAQQVVCVTCAVHFAACTTVAAQLDGAHSSACSGDSAAAKRAAQCHRCKAKPCVVSGALCGALADVAP